MIKVKDIEFIDDLGQIEYLGDFYDLHNDYVCVKIDFNLNQELILRFKHILNQTHFCFCFKNVEISIIELEFEPNLELTLDLLYRGRKLVRNELVEVSNKEQGYIYLTFVEGGGFEFWSSEYEIVVF